jgi:hypothetical protein
MVAGHHDQGESMGFDMLCHDGNELDPDDHSLDILLSNKSSVRPGQVISTPSFVQLTVR